MPFHPASSLAALIGAPVRRGEVVWIGVRPERRAEMLPLSSVEFEAGSGLAGDRYRSAGGARQVTLIAAESLVSIASHLGRSALLSQELRRNIVVRGINLLALKGRMVAVGAAWLDVSGECHPCSRMEEILGPGGYNAVRGLGGITARIVRSGLVRVGDAVEPFNGPEDAARSG